MGDKLNDYLNPETVDCDAVVAKSLVIHFEAIENAQRTIETQQMIIAKVLSAHFEGFRINKYKYNPNTQKFERKEESDG